MSRSAGGPFSSVPSDSDVTEPWPRFPSIMLWFSSDTDVTDLFPGSHGLRHGRLPLTIVMLGEAAGSLTSDRGYDGACQVTYHLTNLTSVHAVVPSDSRTGALLEIFPLY